VVFVLRIKLGNTVIDNRIRKDSNKFTTIQIKTRLITHLQFEFCKWIFDFFPLNLTQLSKKIIFLNFKTIISSLTQKKFKFAIIFSIGT